MFVKVFSSSAPSNLGRALFEARSTAALCDVVLCVDGRDFPAHKAVLAARSPVFQRMFTDGFKETTEKRVMVEDAPSQRAFLAFLEYLYSEKVRARPLQIANHVRSMGNDGNACSAQRCRW